MVGGPRTVPYGRFHPLSIPELSVSSQALSLGAATGSPPPPSGEGLAGEQGSGTGGSGNGIDEGTLASGWEAKSNTSSRFPTVDDASRAVNGSRPKRHSIDLSADAGADRTCCLCGASPT